MDASARYIGLATGLLCLERLRNLNCFFFFQTCNAMPVILFEPFKKGGVWEECQDSQFYWTCALTY